MPVFSKSSELARLMHVDPGLVAAISRSPNKFYRRYTIPKSDGRLRDIRQPRRDLKGIQAWILRNILDRLTASTYATAYIAGKTIVDNVAPHQSNRHFISLDLEDFFPSISARRVVKMFFLVGYSKLASNVLARLCTCRGRLPQGAVTSPTLSNLIAAKLDRRLAGYTSKRNIAYTRYSDDITLSSNNPVVLYQSLSIILKIITSEHFRPNMSKLRVLGPRRRCSITGLVKNNSEARFGIGKRKKRRIRAAVHHQVFGLPRDSRYSSEASLKGWLMYLKSVDEESFHQINFYWNRLVEKSNSV